MFKMNYAFLGGGFPRRVPMRCRQVYELEQLPCVCGSVSYRDVLSRMPYVGTSAKYTVLECETCGLKRTFPVPYDNEVFSDQYHREDFWDRLDNKAHWRSFASRILDLVQEYQPNGRLLDIGCSVGILVELAQEKGFEAVGVDINKFAVQAGRDVLGISLIAGDLRSANFPDGYFDVVTMSQLLEHVGRPVPLLSEIARVLKQGGYLVVESPNYDGLLPRLFRLWNPNKWYGTVPEQHVWQLTPQGITSILAHTPFAICSIRCRRNLYYRCKTAKERLICIVGMVGEWLNMSDNLMVVARPQ